jgi:hypothetical protein
MTNNDTRRMASYLLPDPGGEVVRAMLDEMDSLRARVAELEAALADLCACDWVITLPDRIERVRDIARRALDGAEGA